MKLERDNILLDKNFPSDCRDEVDTGEQQAGDLALAQLF